MLQWPAVHDNATMQTDLPVAEPPKRKRHWCQFSLRTLLIVGSVAPLITFSSFLALQCAAAEPADTANLLREFSGERLDDGEAAALIEKLLGSKPTDDEIPALAQVANSERQPVARHVLAIDALVERHLKARITARELGKMLRGAAWIDRNNLSVLRGVGGHLPIPKVEGDTLFVVSIPEDPHVKNSGAAGVWLRFQGDELNADALFDTLHGKDGPLDKSKLTASAVSPPIRDLIKWIKKRQGM